MLSFIVLMKMVSKGHTTFCRKQLEGLKIFIGAVHVKGFGFGFGFEVKKG